MNNNLKVLQERLGYYFSNEKYLKQALFHPSYIQEENLSLTESNERLEFLGDAVLNLSIADILYQKFPNLPEGLLTKARANLISRASITRLGVSICLEEFLFLSKGEERMGGRSRPSSIGNAMEAVFGAIFLESGFDTAKECITRLLKEAIEDMPFAHQLDDNPKGELQEYLMKKGLPLPIYKKISVSGPPHKPIFEYAIYLNQKELGRAIGSRRQTAEANCAKIALKKIKEGDAL